MLKCLGESVTVCTQGQNFWFHRNSLSVVIQADMLWVGDYCSNILMYVCDFPAKRAYITKALHDDIGSDVAVIWDAMHDVIIKKI